MLASRGWVGGSRAGEQSTSTTTGVVIATYEAMK